MSSLADLAGAPPLIKARPARSKPRRGMTEREAAEIHRMRDRGMTEHQIADATRFSARTIRRLLWGRQS